MATEPERQKLIGYRASLDPAQLGVLRWVEQGCPEGRYEGYSHRVSATALRTRGLIKDQRPWPDLASGNDSQRKSAARAAGTFASGEGNSTSSAEFRK